MFLMVLLVLVFVVLLGRLMFALTRFRLRHRQRRKCERRHRQNQ